MVNMMFKKIQFATIQPFKQWMALVTFALIFFISATAQAVENIPFLLIASAKGDVKTVSAMLEGGASPNTQDAEGVTALMYAARKDRAPVVKLLLEKGAQINTKDQTGWTALIFAAKKNNIATVKLLLENGADPNVVDPTGWSAFTVASAAGFSQVIDALVVSGVDVNAKNEDGKTALMYAAKSGDVPSIQILMRHQADLRSKDKLGATPLMYAAREGNAKALEVLLAQLDQANPSQVKPEKKRIEVVDQTDEAEWTALTWAVKKSKLEAAKVLVSAGADVNHIDAQDTPILHFAVDNGNLDMVNFLLENKVNVKAKDKYGLTALVYALKGQHTEIAKAIKDAGGSY